MGLSMRKSGDGEMRKPLSPKAIARRLEDEKKAAELRHQVLLQRIAANEAIKTRS